MVCHPPWKIVWPEEWASAAYSSAKYLYSVDGVHCRANEIIHPTLAKNTKLYSHKFNQAGFGYELALSLTSNSLVWINGPFVGSNHDVTIFCESGLKETTATGKKGIADQGYRGEKGILCTPSSHDSRELQTFKVNVRTNTSRMCRLMPDTSLTCSTSINRAEPVGQDTKPSIPELKTSVVLNNVFDMGWMSTKSALKQFV